MKKNFLSMAALTALVNAGEANTLLPNAQNSQMAPVSKNSGGMVIGNTPVSAGGNYTGINDPALDSEGAAINAGISAANEERVYTVTIENTGSAEKEVLLNGGLLYAKNPLGLVVNGSFRGKGDQLSDPAVLIGSGSPGKLDELHAWNNQNPTICTMMLIKSNDIAQFSRQILIERQTPFNAGNQISNISIAPYSNEHVEQQNTVTIRKPIIFDNQTLVSIQVPGNTKTSISLFFGASQNITKLFTKKVIEASNNAMRG